MSHTPTPPPHHRGQPVAMVDSLPVRALHPSFSSIKHDFMRAHLFLGSHCCLDWRVNLKAAASVTNIHGGGCLGLLAKGDTYHCPLWAVKRYRNCIPIHAGVGLAVVEEEANCSPETMKELLAFLEDDLVHLFDETGIDKRRYERNVEFRDPITRHNTLDGYLFNIQMLRFLFSPIFELQCVKQTGPNEITFWWTMTMEFALLPWRPQMIFTGRTLMGVNPKTGKFRSHVDYWDSLKNNDYFSFEGLMDLLKQFMYYKTPDLETPKYKVLKRTAVYEVRNYEPFIVAETEGDKLTGSKGFNTVTGYIFGRNSKGEKIPMSTPVFTETIDNSTLDVCIQVVLPYRSQLSELPMPLQDNVKIRQVSGGFMAVIKFSGSPTEGYVMEKEREVQVALTRDGLNTKNGFMLARYNDPNQTSTFIMVQQFLL
eukprot:c14009_g1_i2 orf=610-1887(-)